MISIFGKFGILSGISVQKYLNNTVNSPKNGQKALTGYIENFIPHPKIFRLW